MDAVIRAIEARYPGTRVVSQPYGTPEDPAVRFWLRVLHVREKDLGAVEGFGVDLAFQLYRRRPIPFILSSYGTRNTSRFLAAQRAARGARPSRRPQRLGARARAGRIAGR